MDSNNKNKEAFDGLFWREEILQVLYWMDGEGLAKAIPLSRLQSLLNTSPENLLLHIEKNIQAGYLVTENGLLTKMSSIQLTPAGKKEAGGIFRNAFEGMQKGGHGECGPDCEFCYHEGEKLEDCVHNCADTRHNH